MELFQVDDQGRLFISPAIDDWEPLGSQGITVVFNLDGSLDIGVPCVPNQLLYVFFPIEDAESLPNIDRLHDLARLGASLVRGGATVLSHCGMGHNRSALLAGLILTYLGLTGSEAVALLRQRRRGALYNHTFRNYLESLPSGVPSSTRLLEAPGG